MSRRSTQPTPDREDLSAEEIRQLRRSRMRRRAWIFGAPALLIAIIAGTTAFPLIKTWRATQFVERANSLRAEGRLQEAFNSAASAMQMRPHSPESRRAFASVLLAAGESEGLVVLRELVDEGKGTAQDRLNLAEAALRFEDAPLAEREASQLLQQEETANAARRILAFVRITQRRNEEAVQLLREHLDAGGDSNAALALARLQFAAGTPDAIADAVALLTPLAKKSDDTGLAALILLLDSPAMRDKDAWRWIEAVRKHPLATDRHQLAADDAEIHIEPKNRDAVIERAIKKYRNGTPEQLAALGRWLNHNQEYATVLELIPLEKSLERADLFLIHLDAMAEAGKWKEISEILQTPGLPLRPQIVMLYRGRAARETGENTSADALYHRAVSETAAAPEMLWYAINYLKRVGEYEILEEELLRLTDNAALARQAFAELVPIVQRKRNAEALYALCERMIERLPSDSAAQNDFRYFAALTGRKIDTAGARELLNAEPRMFASRITLALTLLKEGKPADALRVFDGVTVNPSQLPPYQQAILAAVLGANGRENEARQLADSVPENSITGREMELIRPWRTKNSP